jgi:hypothetical protein
MFHDTASSSQRLKNKILLHFQIAFLKALSKITLLLLLTSLLIQRRDDKNETYAKEHGQ